MGKRKNHLKATNEEAALVASIEPHVTRQALAASRGRCPTAFEGAYDAAVGHAFGEARRFDPAGRQSFKNFWFKFARHQIRRGIRRARVIRREVPLSHLRDAHGEPLDFPAPQTPDSPDSPLSAELLTALNLLDARDQFVIVRRFGLSDGCPWPNAAVADALGVSEGGASDATKEALARLRDVLVMA